MVTKELTVTVQAPTQVGEPRSPPFRPLYYLASAEPGKRSGVGRAGWLWRSRSRQVFGGVCKVRSGEGQGVVGRARQGDVHRACEKVKISKSKRKG